MQRLFPGVPNIILTVTLKGRAPAWTPPANVQKLKEDDGTYFRDPNAAKYPKHPLEPAVQAILAAQPDFPESNAGVVDVFACSSTLGNLLRFARGEGKPFRFLVQAIGQSVFLERRENSPTELIPDVRGFGHTFPEAYTSWDTDVRGSVSHQRIIKYNFDGMAVMVRFGADGYLKDKSFSESQSRNPLERATSDTDAADLTAAFANSGLHGLLAAPCSTGSALAVAVGGSLLPQSTILELKTRSFRKKEQDTVGEELPRLWLTQVQNFILAYHEAGLFNDVRQIDVSQRSKQWESDNQDLICKFSTLLHRIVKMARARNPDRLEVRWRESGVLEVSEALPEVGETLPVALQIRWSSLKYDGGSESEDSQYESHGEPNSSYLEDEESDKDFTACSAEDCGYCGHCSY